MAVSHRAPTCQQSQGNSALGQWLGMSGLRSHGLRCWVFPEFSGLQNEYDERKIPQHSSLTPPPHSTLGNLLPLRP